MGIGSGPEDVVVVLVRDHRDVEDIFTELEHGATAPARRRHLVDAATVSLVRHALAEERHLYPAVRRHVEGGGPLADRELAEHAEAEQLMKRLEGLDPADARFEPMVARLISVVRAHFDGEEHELFPLLREACGRDVLMELGDKIRHAERMAPDGPPTGGPARTRTNETPTPGVGMVDRLRDALAGRGR